ncbi:MAG: GxxExxY protein [Opitutaceae bacterium]|nr:GxxExxY protein [Opitutaceae bacterium]
MHPLFQKADAISGSAIAAIIEVHRNKGPGLLESIYERCLMHELSLRKLASRNQGPVKITYKVMLRGSTVGASLATPVPGGENWRISRCVRSSRASQAKPLPSACVTSVTRTSFLRKPCVSTSL